MKFLGNIAFGILLGAISMLVLALCLDTAASTEIKRHSVALYSALATTVAAIFALAGVLSNMDHHRQMDQEARDRKTDSARAFLPSALSNFITVAQRGIRHNYTLSNTGLITGVNRKDDVSCLSMSDETVVIFRELIENSSNKSLRDHLFELLKQHQVAVARSELIGLGSDVHVPTEGYRHLAHWAYIITLANVLFDHARDKTKPIGGHIDANSLKSTCTMYELHTTEETLVNYSPHFQKYSLCYKQLLRD